MTIKVEGLRMSGEGQTLTNSPPKLEGGGVNRSQITNFESRPIKFFLKILANRSKLKAKEHKILNNRSRLSPLWSTDQGLKILGDIC
jgi:hypothetical protein